MLRFCTSYCTYYSFHTAITNFDLPKNGLLKDFEMKSIKGL